MKLVSSSAKSIAQTLEDFSPRDAFNLPLDQFHDTAAAEVFTPCPLNVQVRRRV
ncbi:MAG: hypothetical protein U5R48_09935 [Gammaproteobacteria bacterium]|nr:hypothetical protein [Gammaproteobacteria bacterium]